MDVEAGWGVGGCWGGGYGACFGFGVNWGGVRYGGYCDMRGLLGGGIAVELMVSCEAGLAM